MCHKGGVIAIITSILPFVNDNDTPYILRNKSTKLKKIISNEKETKDSRLNNPK